MSEENNTWLKEEHPELILAPELVSGILQFTAGYNERSGQFSKTNNYSPDERYGTVLSGQFEVNIRGRLDKSTTKLPLLYVNGLDHTPERHFNQTDSSACLCSPLEEKDFLTPEFGFRRFLEQLVIPFLYGQVFLSAHGGWPWLEYAHGATGLFEAYFRNNNSGKSHECIRRLSEDPAWARIKTVLIQKSDIKGHTQCFCPKKDHIRRCHPDAWQGARYLQRDVRSAGLFLP